MTDDERAATWTQLRAQWYAVLKTLDDAAMVRLLTDQERAIFEDYLRRVEALDAIATAYGYTWIPAGRDRVAVAPAAPKPPDHRCAFQIGGVRCAGHKAPGDSFCVDHRDGLPQRRRRVGRPKATRQRSEPYITPPQLPPPPHLALPLRVLRAIEDVPIEDVPPFAPQPIALRLPFDVGDRWYEDAIVHHADRQLPRWTCQDFSNDGPKVYDVDRPPDKRADHMPGVGRWLQDRRILSINIRPYTPPRRRRKAS